MSWNQTDKEEACERIFEIIEEIDALRSEAMSLVSEHSDPSNHERSRRGWNAMIEKALSNDHFWMGSTTMDTLDCAAKAMDPSFVPEDEWECPFTEDEVPGPLAHEVAS